NTGGGFLGQRRDERSEHVPFTGGPERFLVFESDEICGEGARLQDRLFLRWCQSSDDPPILLIVQLRNKLPFHFLLPPRNLHLGWSCGLSCSWAGIRRSG